MLLLFCLFSAVFAKDIPLFASHLTGDNLIEYVNFKQTLFKAARCNFTEEQKRARVMTGIFAKTSKRAAPAPAIDWIQEDTIPASFDSRTQWNSCASIKAIYDQGQCGSCWAFCTAETMSDRTCIATQQQVALSPYDVLTCCTSCGNGCNGGWPTNAFNYWTTTGVCTNGCKPYILPPTGCKNTCLSSSHNPSYQNDKHYGTGRAYSMPNGGVTAIQQEIMAHGPVSATFSVYGDFYQYTSGIYVHTGGAYYGRHCVKVVGWGVDNGTPYWTVANSWGGSWGEHGFFRIIRGRNEVGFESEMAAALPRT